MVSEGYITCQVVFGGYVEESPFELVGGRLSLDFVNTVSGLRGPEQREKLVAYADLLVWARAAGLGRLRRWGARRKPTRARRSRRCSTRGACARRSSGWSRLRWRSGLRRR